ncbi:hypothetical protein M0L20_01740 [Spirosoma sp. RP8]|uniref:Glycosyl transferase n=1 Tax=Spirosoma liriopis TaxID=2937440 RepID=A0ABT0HFB5_9BACT|nr:hypothetical protein [Spirosoma liriopis]MCK8490552.1 hypothetical protein [Spirosoma liriopis]
MDVAFTICTADYLTHALALRDSFILHNPGSRFFICIPDKLDGDRIKYLDSIGIDASQYIEVAQISLSSFPELCKRYSLIELCSALKPFFAHYILQKLTDCERLYYFDCDILIFNSLTHLRNKLKDFDILLTPHILSEHSAEDRLMETQILNAGIYNAGFFGLRKSENTAQMLLWWQNRVTTHGYINFTRGMYADQLWLNFVPLFFQRVCVETHPGCNVAYWNLHERLIQPNGQELRVNQDYDLLFFHFSGFQLNQANLLSRYGKPIFIEADSALALICEQYSQTREKYRYQIPKGSANPYIKAKPIWIEFVRGWLIVLLNKSMEVLGS